MYIDTYPYRITSAKKKNDGCSSIIISSKHDVIKTSFHYTPTVVLLSAFFLKYSFHPSVPILDAFSSTSSPERRIYPSIALNKPFPAVHPLLSPTPTPSELPRLAFGASPPAPTHARPAPKMRTASKPAFIAFPIPTVATGTPLGICTMLCNESTPLRVEVLTGTPITGRGHIAATIPGRCAAPPAPAMITLRPLEAAVCCTGGERAGEEAGDGHLQVKLPILLHQVLPSLQLVWLLYNVSPNKK